MRIPQDTDQQKPSSSFQLELLHYSLKLANDIPVDSIAEVLISGPVNIVADKSNGTVTKQDMDTTGMTTPLRVKALAIGSTTVAVGVNRWRLRIGCQQSIKCCQTRCPQPPLGSHVVLNLRARIEVCETCI